MIYAAMAMIIFYYYSFLHYFRQHFSVQGKRWIFVPVTLSWIAAIYVFFRSYGLHGLELPAIMLVLTVGLRLSTGMNRTQASCAGSFAVLCDYCVRGICMALCAFASGKSGLDFLSNTNIYYTITILAPPLALLLLGFFRKSLLLDAGIKRLADQSSTLKPIVVYEVVAMAHLLIINIGRSYSPYALWYMGVALGACLLTLGMLLSTLYYAIRITELHEHQQKKQIFEEQYARQLRHYKAYQRHTESFRAFRHDYLSMMSTLKALLHANENKEALRLLDSIFDTMQDTVQLHRRYSDSPTYDAILQDLANVCEENEIRFSCQAPAPKNASLTLLQRIQVFSNLTNNAVEACLKVPAPERFIEISSTTEHGWITLQVINSFSGELRTEKGRLLTTKTNPDVHGLGLKIVNDLVESVGGLVVHEVNTQRKTFLIRVHIPQIHGEKEEPT